MPPWCESGAGRVGGFGTCFVGCACRRACACARLRACMCVHVHVFVRACVLVCDDCDAEGIHINGTVRKIRIPQSESLPCSSRINLKSPCGHLNARPDSATTRHGMQRRRSGRRRGYSSQPGRRSGTAGPATVPRPGTHAVPRPGDGDSPPAALRLAAWPGRHCHGDSTSRLGNGQ